MNLTTAQTGIGTCTMGCPNCQKRARYAEFADAYYKKGYSLGAIGTLYGFTRQFIHRSINKALEYGYVPPQPKKKEAPK